MSKRQTLYGASFIFKSLVMEKHYKIMIYVMIMIFVMVMKMEMLWNGYRAIILPCCCSFRCSVSIWGGGLCLAGYVSSRYICRHYGHKKGTQCKFHIVEEDIVKVVVEKLVHVEMMEVLGHTAKDDILVMVGMMDSGDDRKAYSGQGSYGGSRGCLYGGRLCGRSEVYGGCACEGYGRYGSSYGGSL